MLSELDELLEEEAEVSRSKEQLLFSLLVEAGFGNGLLRLALLPTCLLTMALRFRKIVRQQTVLLRRKRLTTDLLFQVGVSLKLKPQKNKQPVHLHPSAMIANRHQYKEEVCHQVSTRRMSPRDSHS